MLEYWSVEEIIKNIGGVEILKNWLHICFFLQYLSF